MTKIPGINHLNAVKAFEKAGFIIKRQGKHVVMSDGVRIITIQEIIQSMLTLSEG